MRDTLTDVHNQAVQRLLKANAELLDKAQEPGLCAADWPPLKDALAIQRGAILHLIAVNNLIADYQRQRGADVNPKKQRPASLFRHVRRDDPTPEQIAAMAEVFKARHMAEMRASTGPNYKTAIKGAVRVYPTREIFK